MLMETRSLIQTQRARLIPQVANIEMYDLSKYSVARTEPSYELGQAISAVWDAPGYHGQRDWVGVYKVGSNKNKQVTNISSRGLWKWAADLMEDVTQATTTANDDAQGRLTFGGNQLPWQPGTYELRYHHDGKHNVMAVSDPFDIVAPTPKEAGDTTEVERTLLRLIQNALDNNPDTIPTTPTDGFIGLGEIEARHIVEVIRWIYGVEFAWEVVLVDNTVARLTKRVRKRD
jgi:phosphatidylethanolamine N-methyltransferase